MFDKRLVGLVPEAKRAIAFSVAWQLVGLLGNIVLIWLFAYLFCRMYYGELTVATLLYVAGGGLLSAVVRSVAARQSVKYNFRASSLAKKRIRHRLYAKLLAIGPSYSERVLTAEAVQLASEGVEQLEIYFGAFLPQFFYSMIAPFVLFGVMATVSVKAAVTLLIGVPLIPLSIVGVQRLAKRLLAKYWGRYTALGDSFLENLQGLTTLKIYGADEAKNRQMNAEAEGFRRATMRVLTMQLNSIIVMDIVAFGGAALGIMVALHEVAEGSVMMMGAVLILLLAADFFIPMRQLGSFFHVAMNGMAAADKMFRLLDMPIAGEASRKARPGSSEIMCSGVHFSYTAEREILRGVDIFIPSGHLVALVGESGCGKSTVARLFSGRLQGYRGDIQIGEYSLRDIAKEDISSWITTVGHVGYIFRGTIRENLEMAAPKASVAQMEEALRQVELLDELAERGGLDMKLENEGSNLSGGQRQRLNLARALLHDSPIYIFDEATSNVDVESEDAILNVIYRLAERKTILLITHRLLNASRADQIYVLDAGVVAEAGTHEQLLRRDGQYGRLWRNQEALEKYGNRS